MPLIRKMEDLRKFCANLLDKRNGKREIGFYNLEYEIAEVFGFSKYVQKSVLEALLKFQLIDRGSMANQFRILYNLDSKKDAEEEVDELLGKFE